MPDKFREFFLAPSTAHPLALLRIFLGVMMTTETYFLWPSLDDLYGPYGFLEAALMNAIAGTNAPSFAILFEKQGWNYLVFLHTIFWLRWIFLGTFTLGLCTRASTVILWLFQSFIMFSGPVSSYGIDRYFHVCLFLLMWMPSGSVWSLDSLRSKLKPCPTPTATYSLRILQLAILITYVNAGVAKAMGFEWWNGDAIWRALHMPEFQYALFSGHFMWLGDWPLLAKILGWSTIVLETFYFIAVWIPGLGLLWSLAIIGMHLGISLAMGLVNFGVTMALINVALFVYPVLATKQFLRGHQSKLDPLTFKQSEIT